MNKNKIKIELMTNGIQIPPSTRKILIDTFGENFYKDDYVTTTGIMLEIDKNTYVTANINNNSIYELYVKNNILYIKTTTKIPYFTNILPVKIWVPSQFVLEKTKNEYGFITNYVNSQFDRIRISPISGCNFHCAFCSLNCLPYRKNSIAELDLAFKEALKDNRITHTLITGGTPKIEDLPYLTEVYTYFCKQYTNMNFDIMMTPRGFDSFTDETQYEPYLQYLHSIGVCGLSINIELFNNDLCAKYCKDKYALGRENYLKFLKLASQIFGSMNVRSGLIVGLESKEDTLLAVEEICKCGCLPMLSPYVPYNNIGTKPSADFLYDVLNDAKKIIKNYNLKLAPLCKKCKHNTL